MNKLILLVLAPVLGLGTGVGGAIGTQQVLASRAAAAHEATAFVQTGAILAPLVFADGRLAGYVSFRAEIEVPADKEADVRQHLPVLLDAVNMRTFRAPMATGPDGMIAGVATFKAVLLDAATATFGKQSVRRVVVTQAEPA